jgi:putative ABC transport system permease protein
LGRADPGFRAAGVLTAEIALPRLEYDSYAATQRFWDRLVERIAALPGVSAAAMVTSLPLVPQDAFHDLAIDLEDRPEETRAAISVYHATPGYFAALGIPVVAGKGLQRADFLAVERPVLLSAAAARKLFPGRSAVGRRIRRSVTGEADQPWATVAGVVGDVPRERIGGAPAEIVYLPLLDEAADSGLTPAYGALVVRANVPAASLAPAVREALRDLDPHLPLANVRPLGSIVAESASRTTLVTVLLSAAAVAALALGTLGLYGVLSFTVNRRAREFSIRLALGAGQRDVRRMVLRESVGLAAGGITIGLVTTLLLTRFLRGLLYGVSPSDPLAVASMAALVLVVSLLAGWVPARRAVRADPVTVLRGE